MPERPPVLVDRASPVPLYFQVAQQLQQAIESGALPPGSRLDNEIVLAAELGLSRPTMRQAIQYLVDQGLLVRKRGVGTHVARPRVRRPVGLTSLYDDLVRAGQEPSSTVLSQAVTPASGVVADALEIPESTPVIMLERLRRTRGEPLALLRNHLRADLPVRRPGGPEGAALGDVAADVLAAEVLARRGLYEVLREAGVTLGSATQSIGARRGTAAEAALLDEPRGAPLLTMRRTTFDDRGVAVEYGDHLYRASRYSFEVALTDR